MTLSFTVSDNASLMAALAASKGGETIYLEGGDYGALRLIDGKYGDFKFASEVKLVAADANNPPVVTNLDMRGAGNITFDGIRFDYTYEEGQQIWHKPFKVLNSSDITITNSHFSGDTASGLGEPHDGYPTAFGLHMRHSDSFTLSNSTIEGFFRGATLSRSDDVTVTGNEFYGIRMDGLNFSAVQGVLIEDNHLHNFIRSIGSSDHADMIQFWTNGTDRPSTDVVIRGNTLDAGAGEYTQSIFMRNDLVDRGLAGEEMFYRNILIEENVIINKHVHGISVGETDGLIIRNNTVVQGVISDDEVATLGLPRSTPRISVNPNSENVEISQNVTSVIAGYDSQKSWSVTGNVLVQNTDPMAPNYYGNIFVGSSLGLDGIHTAYVVSPGGLLDDPNLGAAALREPFTGAAFNMFTAKPGATEVMFDASMFASLHPAGTEYSWNFGDGTTATGAQVMHEYAIAGRHMVQLTLTYPNGHTSVAGVEVGVQSAELLRMGDDGSFLLRDMGTESSVTPANTTEGGGLALGGAGISAQVAYSAVRPFLNDDAFDVSFAISAGTPGETGEIFRLHGSFIVSVNGKGEVQLRAWQENGTDIRLVTAGHKLNDGAFHDVGFRLEDGKLALTVGNQVVTEAPFEGTLRDRGNNDLIFGNNWHSEASFFAGEFRDFEITLLNAAPSTPELARPEEALVPESPIFEPVVEEKEVPQEEQAPEPIQDSQSEPNTAEPVREATITLDGAVALGTSGIHASIGRSQLQDLFSQTEMEIGFAIGADMAGKTGEVFRLHGSFLVNVNRGGEIQVRAWSSEGDYVLLRSGPDARVNDGGSHDVDIQLSDGRLSLWVNGEIKADASFEGSFRDRGNHDLTFGNRWHEAGRFFDGEVNSFAIDFGADNSVTSMNDHFAAFASFHDMPLI